MAARNWTPEQRKKQAEKIRKWKPWAQSTGPRSAEGRAKSARNSFRGGLRHVLREISLALRAQKEILDRR